MNDNETRFGGVVSPFVYAIAFVVVGLTVTSIGSALIGLNLAHTGDSPPIIIGIILINIGLAVVLGTVKGVYGSMEDD